MNGVPVLADVCAALAAAIEARHDCGDHSLFVGRVLALRDDERAPLAYHAGKYATLHYQEDGGGRGADRFLGTGATISRDGRSRRGFVRAQPGSDQPQLLTLHKSPARPRSA